MEIRPFRPADEGPVVALWERCGLVRPWNDPRKDIARKVATDPEGLLVGTVDGAVVSTVMVGYDGHRGWVNYLAVAPEGRLVGLGRRLMQAAEERLAAAGCPKINLQVRGDNTQALGFYRALGYQVDDVVSLGRRLEHDG